MQVAVGGGHFIRFTVVVVHIRQLLFVVTVFSQLVQSVLKEVSGIGYGYIAVGNVSNSLDALCHHGASAMLHP